MHYNDTEPWPTEPDGGGPTLELINYTWDNALPESWAASALHGTPGQENGNFVSVQEPVVLTQEVSCRVVPNPFRNSAVLRVNSDNVMEDASVRIFNLFGQEVMRLEQINSNYIPIFAESLPSGIYVYRLANSRGGVLFTGKFVVD